MNKRKRIGVLIADPGSDDSQRVLEGICSQCAQYDYDVLVFSPMVEVCHPDKKYLKGELNILELVNYDVLDGVIIGTLSLTWDRVQDVLDNVLEKLKRECTKPVVSLDLAIDGYETVLTDDCNAIRELVKHLVHEHGCKKMYCLTGTQGYVVAEDRAKAFIEQMNDEGLEAGEETVFYGDFWITSGKAFAERLLSGEVELPDAVVCTNDTMAIALANRLMEGGIKVPEQVRVTGYDASRDAAFNTVSITTYIPDIFTTAARAVDMIHEKIEPDSEKKPMILPFSSGISVGRSCGCTQNTNDLQRFLGYNYNPQMRQRNADGSLTCNDLQGLNSSFMFETLSGIDKPYKLLARITDVTYLLQPYRRFYLCMREDWADPDKTLYSGYPEQMKCVIRSMPTAEQESENDYRFSGVPDEFLFPTSQMLPAIYDERPMPVVFYFAPVHFGKDTMGYAVLQTELGAKRSADNVFQVWLRNINNAVQMVRVVSKLIEYSVHDAMTGLLNRRGMEKEYSCIAENSAPDDNCLVFVIDMDKLKFINDTYGHESGDMGIMTVAAAAKSIADENDICVRAGGDEFFVIKCGKVTEADGNDYIRRFEEFLAAKNAGSNLPFEITASIGFECAPIGSASLDDKIKAADERMYAYKIAHKRERRS